MALPAVVAYPGVSCDFYLRYKTAKYIKSKLMHGLKHQLFWKKETLVRYIVG